MQRDDKSAAAADIDGSLISGDEKDDEDLDGVPLDGAALLKSAMMRGIPSTVSGGVNTASPARLAASTSGAAAVAEQKVVVHRRGTLEVGRLEEQDSDFDDDIDGIPVDDDIDGVPLDASASKSGGGGFLPSKWETVDPDQVEAQAITTSKWDTLDPVAPEPPSFSSLLDYNSGEPSADDPATKRSRLREIEVKIVQYQDELESGERSLKSGWTIAQQTEHYRRKLMRKDTTSTSDASDSPLAAAQRRSDMRRSVSPSSARKPTTKKSKRSPSPSYTSSSSSTKRRSRSPHAKRYGRDSTSPAAKSSK